MPTLELSEVNIKKAKNFFIDGNGHGDVQEFKQEPADIPDILDKDFDILVRDNDVDINNIPDGEYWGWMFC